MKGQYGQLDKENWTEDIKQGMSECMRVLKSSGTLIFKWNENQVKLKDVLKAVEPYSPLFGNKRSQTHWLVFMKEEQQKPVLPEFVAKWFEDAKDNLEIPIFYECVRAMEICKEYRNEFHQWFANSKKNPIETLIRMKDGYEVEKEPMYYVILSENKGGWKYTFLDEEGNADYTNNKAHIPTFTEKEIKGNDERFWPFAVPVKEVEG